MPVEVRQAVDADLERLLEIHRASFPDPRTTPERRRVFLANRLGGLSDARVAVRGGEVVGHAFGFQIELWFGGRRVPAVGVASLGVAPEARRGGVAGALLAQIHREAVSRGAAISLLYPFRQGFYSRHGYAPVSPFRVLSVHPAAIPRAWEDASPGELRVATGHDRDAMIALYERAAQAGTGALSRRDAAWERDLADESRNWSVLRLGETVVGYTSFTLVQAEAHAEVRAVIHEVVAASEAARFKLLSGLRRLGDQVHTLEMMLADDDPLPWLLEDGDRHRFGTAEVEHPLGTLAAGPMVAMLDVRRALEARGYRNDGCQDLEVGRERVRLEVRDGIGRVAPLSGDAPLVIEPRVLASIAFGGMPVRHAERLGLVSGRHLPAVAALLELPAFFSSDPF